MDDATTEDGFLDNRLRLRQPAKGYRAGADAVLLAAAIEAPAGARLLEAGCGVGAAMLCAVARLGPGVSVLGVEAEPAFAAWAVENAARNGLADRVSVLPGDIFDPALEIGQFDGVFYNPPFDQAGGQRPAPRADRRHAYLTDRPILAWVKALADRLKGGAHLTLIHRAEALAEILAALEGRLGAPEVSPIRPTATEPAKRVLVRARKGGRSALRLYRGLDLHDHTGAKFTPEAQAIFCGAPLPWA